MSQLLINQYLNELATLKRVSGAQRESVVREAFKDLLKAWGKSQSLIFIPEHEFITTAKVRNYVDGALLHDLRVPFGYWEAKDADDDLDEEIAKKFRRGYPNTNIIFEDSTQAVLIQNGAEVVRCATTDGQALENLLTLFFAYQRPEIAEFRKAIVQFKTDLPAVLEALRERINDAYAANEGFKAAAAAFLKQAKDTINPSISADDVREMLIQHILTEDIFARVFGNDDFHRENNVAKALYGLEGHFFRGDVKRQTLQALEPYYASIRSTAALISSHSEKQGFLKAIYENFYKVYNPHAADRLGVVYTPNEIVRFMVESADWLCEKHFGKSLIDKGVEILDPATGTGTFIVEILEHFRGRPADLKYKYLNELHANEVAILPYYVANLNIEATYAAIEGEYAEFPGLCFVDTLDNVAALGIFSGHQHEMFGAISDENIERVKRQNARKISVIIGNPPYNANQQSENDNNKNREYRRIDDRIKNTYLRQSAAQKTKLYDPYARFFRWASDRLTSGGIVAFITNRSFLDAKNFDGFRKSIRSEFQYGYVIDLGGDYKRKDFGGGGNVFGIGTGVAISFWVKQTGKQPEHPIRYLAAPKIDGEEKLRWLSRLRLSNTEFSVIQPSSSGFWLDHPEDYEVGSIPMISKAAKNSGGGKGEHAIFHRYSLGVSTNRDEWVYGRSKSLVAAKARALINAYDALPSRNPIYGNELKWSRNLKRRHARGESERFHERDLTDVLYRPFSKRVLYMSRVFTDEHGLAEELSPASEGNRAITFSGGTRGTFSAAATGKLVSLDFYLPNAATYVTRYRYVGADCHDNITDWALAQFTAHYGDKATINKNDIFAYVYAVLHDPTYRETYALNLKREFPRIPFYADFKRWRDWGQALLDLHIGYEAVEPFGLVRTDASDPKRAEGTAPAVKLKSDHEHGNIMLDADTQLSGVPPEAWRYVLGNRTAIDWVLDQHKEKTPKDPTIREKFNTYRFADYKETVIDLLDRVTTVSVETVAITDAMAALKR